MSNRYVFPIVVEQGEDGGVGMYFPDFPGTAVLAENITEGVLRAKEVLVSRILEIEEKNASVPTASAPASIELEDPSDRIVFLDVFMPPFRDEAANKAVTKNCTLPKWLRDASEEAGLNFSQVLQYGLKEALGIDKQKSEEIQ